MGLTRMAVGAASPTAQGHAITITARENMNENSAGPADGWQNVVWTTHRLVGKEKRYAKRLAINQLNRHLNRHIVEWNQSA